METSNNSLTHHAPKTCECSKSAGEWRAAFKQQQQQQKQMNNNNTLTLTLITDFKCQQHTPGFCQYIQILLCSKIIYTAVIFATFPCCPQMLSRIQVIFTTSNAALPIFLSVLTCCYPRSIRTLAMFATSSKTPASLVFSPLLFVANRTAVILATFSKTPASLVFSPLLFVANRTAVILATFSKTPDTLVFSPLLFVANRTAVI